MKNTKWFFYINSILCFLVIVIKSAIFDIWCDNSFDIYRLSSLLFFFAQLPQLFLLFIAAALFLFAAFYSKETHLIVKAGAVTELFCGIIYIFINLFMMWILGTPTPISIAVIFDIPLIVLGIQGFRKKID